LRNVVAVRAKMNLTFCGLSETPSRKRCRSRPPYRAQPAQAQGDEDGVGCTEVDSCSYVCRSLDFTTPTCGKRVDIGYFPSKTLWYLRQSGRLSPTSMVAVPAGYGGLCRREEQ